MTADAAEQMLLVFYRAQADHFHSMARMAGKPLLRERLVALAQDYEALVECIESGDAPRTSLTH